MEPEWNPRGALLSALDLPDDPSSDPYMYYVESSWPGRGERQEFIRLFVDVISSLKGECDIIEFHP
jgi:hypothetical protein